MIYCSGLPKTNKHATDVKRQYRLRTLVHGFIFTRWIPMVKTLILFLAICSPIVVHGDPEPDPEASPSTSLFDVLFGPQRVGCYDVSTIEKPLNEVLCEQPYFVKFITKTDSNVLIDNICYTYFPLPDDPYTFNLYRSIVFCDGSFRVETAIITDVSIGRYRVSDPFCTFSSNVLGYAGCETYVTYRCYEFGDCMDACQIGIVGLSPSCLPMGLSCLQKVQEILDDACLPETDLYVLPMKVPNRCVTEQMCINPSVEPPLPEPVVPVGHLHGGLLPPHRGLIG